jgi:hypothetical protein
MGLAEMFDKLSPEYHGESLYIEEIVFCRGDPLCFIRRQGTSWYYTMQVNMVPESLIPCVQYGCKANSASKVISAELQKGFRDSFKQDRVDRFPVTEGNRIQFMGQSKDVVEVRYRQKLSLAVFKPLCLCQTLTLWAMTVTTGIVCVLLESALLALLYMTTEI